MVLRRCDPLEPELLIAIKDQVFVRRFKGKCLAQLLDDPTASRILRDVNVQDAPPIMADCLDSNQKLKKSKCFIQCRLGTRNPFFLSLNCTEFVPNSIHPEHTLLCCFPPFTSCFIPFVPPFRWRKVISGKRCAVAGPPMVPGR